LSSHAETPVSTFELRMVEFESMLRCQDLASQPQSCSRKLDFMRRMVLFRVFPLLLDIPHFTLSATLSASRCFFFTWRIIIIPISSKAYSIRNLSIVLKKYGNV